LCGPLCRRRCAVKSLRPVQQQLAQGFARGFQCQRGTLFITCRGVLTGGLLQYQSGGQALRPGTQGEQQGRHGLGLHGLPMNSRSASMRGQLTRTAVVLSLFWLRRMWI
jgi:hypothetical protein